MPLDLFAFFSEKRFQCLNFHDVTLLDDSQVETIIRSLEEINKFFIKAINHHQPIRPVDGQFYHDLQAWVDTKLSDVYDETKRAMLVETCAEFMEFFYPNATHQVKLLTGCITAAAIVVDDCMDDPAIREQARLFTYRYLRNLPQPEGACAVFDEIMRESDIFFQHKDPQVANIAIMSCLNFTDSTYLEAHFVDEQPPQIASTYGGNKQVKWCADKFPYYLRNFTGMPGFYGSVIFTPSHELGVPPAYWLPAVEDMNKFINVVNDLFSFSKELKSRETTNNIPLQTHVKHRAGYKSRFNSPDGFWTCRDTLYDIVRELIANAVAVDELLVVCADQVSEDFEEQTKFFSKEGITEEETTLLGIQRHRMEMSKMAAKLWKDFRQGYVGSYIGLRRYGLDSLRENLVQECPCTSCSATRKENLKRAKIENAIKFCTIW